MTWPNIVLALGSLGFGSILTTIIPLAWRQITGREARRVTDAERAWGIVRSVRDENADLHSTVRRVKEHASYLRQMLLERGVRPDELPPWPTDIHSKEKPNE